ncbi:hypothetical protein GCM10022215_32490 [Nocardioides fonticola]|uniref:Uncharacterized protein n=1 Tax=Nocardioides fonticola TaxID=450363 RepID=A0ABP7XRP2_9ACTN
MSTHFDRHGLPIGNDCPTRHPVTGHGCIRLAGHADAQHYAIGTSNSLEYFTPAAVVAEVLQPPVDRAIDVPENVPATGGPGVGAAALEGAAAPCIPVHDWTPTPSWKITPFGAIAIAAPAAAALLWWVLDVARGLVSGAIR